jgi:hypothetical protein
MASREIRQHGAMVLVRKGHWIGAGATRGLVGDRYLGAVMKIREQRRAVEARHAFRADDIDRRRGTPDRRQVVALTAPMAPLPNRIAPMARSSVSMRCTLLVAA